MKTKLIAAAILAGGSLFAQSRFVPSCPEPGYSMVDRYRVEQPRYVPQRDHERFSTAFRRQDTRRDPRPVRDEARDRGHERWDR
jgi:hypothetical protein